MSSSAQRKRKPAGSSPPSRTKTGRAANSRASTLRTAVDPSDPVDTLDSVTEGVEEVVDLTREASDAAVVDLTTANDSVLLVDEAGPLGSRLPPGQSYVLSSDEDEDPVVHAAIASSAHTARSTSGLVSCPICLDLYAEIVDSGRLVVSTKCGHVFCSQCLRDALTASHTCPTCRKRLTARQYHPLYI